MASVAMAAPGWRGIAGAMAASGAAAFVSALLSLAATKILAVAGGPAPVALLATLQQVRAAAVTAATLNGSAALIQGACALGGGERREYLRTALVLVGAAALGVTVLLLAAPRVAAGWAGLGESYAGMLRIAALAVLPGAIHAVLAALLNAVRALRRLALVQIVSPAVLALLAWPAARSLAYPGNGSLLWLAAWMAAPALAAALAAAVLLRPHWGEVAAWLRGEGAWWKQAAAQRFLRVSGTLFAGGLAYSGVVVAVRAGIVRMEGLEVAGRFDAAWSVSMSQATLVLASMQTYYLPALSAPAPQAVRAAHIRRMLLAGAVTAAALLAVLIAVKPLVIRLLYSEAFLSAGRYLRWTLPGDYLKVTSWILSLPLLASGDTRAFLAADLCALGVYAAGARLAARWFSPGEAAAAAFAAMYAAHLLVCGARLWMTGAFRPDRRTAGAWLAGAALVAGASAAYWGQP